MKPYLARPKPYLIAHRGGAALAPENTFAAFDNAVKLGADALELDARLTRDGEVVVIHDASVERVTDGKGLVAETNFADLARLDAGHCFRDGDGFPFRGRGVHIPRLADLFARHPRVLMNIEAKDTTADLAEALVAVIKKAGKVDEVCIGSEDDVQGERLRALLPEACQFFPSQAAACHILAARMGNDASGCPGGYQLLDVPMWHEGMLLLDDGVVAALHARGIPIHAWTIDDESDMRTLIERGVDGIMTDRPDVLRRVLGR